MNLQDYKKVAWRAETAKNLCNVLDRDWKDKELGIDEFKDRYFDELKRRLIVMKEFSGDQDVETVSDTAFVEARWCAYKKIYEFNPTFIRYLAATEAGEISISLLKKLPFRSFYISFGGEVLDSEPFPGFVPCIGMFVYIYFTKVEEDEYAHFAMTLRGVNETSIPLYCGIKDRCVFTEVTNIDKMPKAVWNYITHNGDPKQIEMVKRKQKNQKQFFMIVMNACQYLCASNAEIKDVKVDKKHRPVITVNGKDKPIAMDLSQVGVRLGQKFEKMYRDLESECQREGRKGIRKRPHVRRAHWHHYWTGPGRTVLTVKWLEPVFVMGTDDEIDTVIHEVKGEIK